VTVLRWTSIHTVGVVANPHAGRGEGAAEAAIASLFEHLAGREIVVCRGSFADEVARRSGTARRAVTVPGAGGPPTAEQSAARLAAEGVDLMIGIGGDGTLCDIAAALLAADSRIPLYGIGIGSSNVGPLVSATGDRIARIDWDRVAPVDVHGLQAGISGRPLGVAFNDVVCGNTYFATRNGRRVDLAAADKIRGVERPATPRTVCGAGTWLAKNGQRVLSGADLPMEQIIASPLNRVETCAGKAVSGFLSWGPYVGMHAVVAAASSIMVRTKLSIDDATAAEPLHLCHIGIGPDDLVEVGGFLPNAVIVIDGNPAHILSPEETLQLRLKQGAIAVLREISAS